MASQRRKRILIIGAGFGGLAVANRLMKRDDVEILIIDRHNFHTFTPLLYQVATCALDPSEIAYPVRGIYRRRKNVRFLLGTVVDIQREQKQVLVYSQDEEYHEHYDYLVIAAGSVTNFFGNQKLMRHAFEIKDLNSGVTLRNHILKLFERAAWTKDGALREALTTFVIVGGGPTGLETAGALYELYTHVLEKEFNRVNGIKTRVVLVEAHHNLLHPYPVRLQRAALRQLEGLGVEVILGQRVTEVDKDYIVLDNGETIPTYTLVWAAGVKASPLAEKLNVPLGQGGRIPVEPTMQVIGAEAIYAVGDITTVQDADGNPYPQVIPVAQQQGWLTARNIAREMSGSSELESFRYSDRGIMATIGRRRAVAWPYYKVQLTGYLAWLTWLGLHLLWLMGFRNRLNVFVNWIWNYFTYDRSARIVIDHEVQSAPKQDTQL